MTMAPPWPRGETLTPRTRIVPLIRSSRPKERRRYAGKGSGLVMGGITGMPWGELNEREAVTTATRPLTMARMADDRNLMETHGQPSVKGFPARRARTLPGETTCNGSRRPASDPAGMVRVMDWPDSRVFRWRPCPAKATTYLDPRERNEAQEERQEGEDLRPSETLLQERTCH